MNSNRQSNFQVLVLKDENLMGRLFEVDIVSSGKHYLVGKLVNEKEVHRPKDVPPPLTKGQVSGIRNQLHVYFIYTDLGFYFSIFHF